jgi:hypothetical protein
MSYNIFSWKSCINIIKFFFLILLISMELAFGVWVGNIVLLTLMMWAGNIIDDTPVLELGKESFMCHFEA